MSHPSWQNTTVTVPGTTVTAHIGQNTTRPSEWAYTLWSQSQNGVEELIASGGFHTEGLEVTPEQVAHVAFLLEIEYQ